MSNTLPSQQGRTIVITGANTGIGRVTALELARAGAFVVIAGRSHERTRPVLEEIGEAHCTFIPLDLGSLESVREAASAILALDRPIDVLINNAGLAGARGTTADGFERTFGVNHLGHYLLTYLLLERVKEAPSPSRIVNVASKAHLRAKRMDFDALTQATASSTGFPEYTVSKLANVLFTRALARRLEQSEVVVHALHPGVVATEVWRNVPQPFAWLIKQFMISEEEGAQTTLHCATTAEAAECSGEYWVKSKRAPVSALAEDRALEDELWRRSAEWVGVDWA